MPQAVAHLEQAQAAVGLPDLAVGVEVGDVGKLGADAQFFALNGALNRAFQRAEMGGKPQVVVTAEVLRREHHHAVPCKGGFHVGQVTAAQRLCEVDVTNLGGEVVGDGEGADGHGVSRELITRGN